MHSIIVDIRITADEYLKQYKLPNAVVVTQSRCGRRVKFPANILQKFVSYSGIDGSFRIQFSADGKMQSVEQLTKM